MMRIRPLRRYAVFTSVFSLIGAGAVFLSSARTFADERIGSTSSPLTTSNDITLWAEGDSIPVCWETSGYDREKRIVKAAVTGTWEFFAKINFTGWDDCPTSGSAEQVRIRISPQDASDAGAGGSARLGKDALSAPVDNSPGVNLSFNPDGTADQGRVEYVGVHEFGHVLGFTHEQDRTENKEGKAGCNTYGVDPDARPYTPYDRDSIMNYCNRDGNMFGNLTDIDVAGVQAAYGVRRQNVLPQNSCASNQFNGLVSLTAPWNHGGRAAFAVFPNDGTHFGYHAQWNTDDGGWGDEVKWFSGDFNGDGLADIGAAWNNGGINVLSVRASNGSSFVGSHWDVDAGGWMDTTKWLPGDFNGDGKTDVVAPWNHGGKAAFAVFFSDGNRFLYRQQWNTDDGGWADNVRWFTGDFDGDGKSDLGAAWNNDGRITLSVRRSTGVSFEGSSWLADAGRWSDSSVFLAGDFDADGKADVAELWNDLGRVTSTVFLSNGGAFRNAGNWTVRDGGWGAEVKWFPGDFNGDGRTDIGAAWNNWGTNVLSVRRASGRSFVGENWSTNAGGWMDSTAWCVGKFQ